MSIPLEKEQWTKVARWVLLAGGWLLILTFLGRSAYFAYLQTFLELGPAKIVGTRNVIYHEAGGYLYTNPGAMLGLHLRCLATQFGITLLAATLATVLFCGYQRLAKQKVWALVLRILFWCAMVLAFLFIAVICVWEWGLAWLGLLLCIRFLPHWTNKSKFTLLALLVAIVLFGCHRKNLEWTYRKYESFWDSAEQCTTMEQFVKAFGEPIFLRKNISSEAKEWFDNLAHCDQSLWLPEKTLAAFFSPQMPDILLLPWFDDDGNRIALAWCDLTPERLAILENETKAATSVE